MRFHAVTLAVLATALLLASFLSAAAAAPAKATKGSKLNNDVKCGVCSTLLNALEDRVASAAREHPYDVLSRFRLDEKRKVPYSRSETFIESLLDSPSSFSSLWNKHGFLRAAAAPMRLVPRDGAGSDPRVQHSTAIRNQFAAIAADIFDDHVEALSLALARARSRDAAVKSFCVESYRACTEWPAVWGEATDPMPEPEKPKEEEAKPQQEDVKPAATDAAAEAGSAPADTAAATEAAPAAAAAAVATEAKDEL